MKVYGHLRDDHSTNMAQKVVYAAPAKTVVPTEDEPKAKSKLNGDAANAGSQTKTPAQAKATYSYPWWASKEAVEVFWGQANELVPIVPPPKYLECVKSAMGREVFEQELSEPQALLEEFQERVGIATIEDLKSKISVTKPQRILQVQLTS